MVKKITIYISIFVASFTWAQNNNNNASVGKCYLSGQIIGAENQNLVFCNQNQGSLKDPIATIPLDKEGKFTFEHDLIAADYYFIKFPNNQLLHIILHGNDTIKIYGDSKDIIRLSNIVGSEDSEIMNEFLTAWTDFKALKDSLTNVLRFNPAKQAEVDNYFKPFAQDFYMKRNNLINRFSDSPALLATINAIDQDKEWEIYQTVVHHLTVSFPESPTIQNLAVYTNQQIAEREKKAFLKPGNPAKDIALPNPQGDTLRLSDFKGKVVLLDFWASWCAPCRRENPNVVNMYHLYKEDGFTVYSVSLDQNKDKWVDAIEKDGLVWPNHVSDLKGWGSVGGATYMVKSIPFTVLIDKEGNIIGTNIRGPELQNQLKAIFGH